MESQHQRKSTTPTGHENHGVHVCHKCGWPFPNPHPSAKHRRAHKRICGTIEGYKQNDSEVHMNLIISDDEHIFYEDLRTPSPKIEKKSIIEMGSVGVGERSNRSEDEVFSDAVTEFSDNGFSPRSEEHFKGSRESDTNAEKVVDGDLATNQLLEGDENIEASQIHNPEVLEIETNHSGKTSPLQNSAPSCITDSMVSSEEFVAGFSSTNGTVRDDKSETFTEAPKDYINTNIGNNGIESTSSLEQESEPKGNEEISLDKSLSDGGFLEVSGRNGDGNENFHVPSVEYDLPIVDSPEVMVEDFKDHKGMKLNLPIALGCDEVIKCVKDDTKEPAIEESHSDFNFIESGERIDLYSQDTVTLEGKADTYDVKITSGEDLGSSGVYDSTSEMKVISSEDLGSSGLEASLDSRIQGLQHLDFDNYSSHDMLSESLLGEDTTRNLEKRGIELSDRAGDQNAELVAEEICPRKTETTMESKCNFSESHVSDRVEGNLEDTESNDIKRISNSREGGIDTTDLVNTIDIRSNSQNCRVEDSTEAVSADTRSNRDRGNDDDVLQRSRENPISKEPESLSVHSEFGIKSNAVSSEPLQEEADGNLTKQLDTVSAVDSSSLTDSLEGNWGSVSVLSTQSDTPTPVGFGSQAQGQPETAILQKPNTDQSDAFEAPSFMTLVESGNWVDRKTASSKNQTFENTKQPKTEALQAGWFPSITNVNESQGRKRNEEIIAKITNWSTVKQHTPLKSLLGEANLETKPKSPKPKEAPTLIQNNGALAPTTLNSILQADKKEKGKEWNSPARYPKENKKEKRKVRGKTHWVPFVCCYSIN